ncbi:hypothetical protein [Microbacterium sp. MMO-10]|uniref:hypothetical protein n=1 Tax=Microbacterium sp. MMO-10 TaxID=3081272 RepID=UPI00301775F7
MLQDSTNENRMMLTARRGPDGLAQIGASRFDITGIRFVTDDEGAEGVTGDDQEQDAGEDEDGAADEQDSADEGDGFEGEFDAKRARTLITKLRGERDKARQAAADAAKGGKEDPKLQGENLRLRIALRAGLDEDLADRLRGSTEDELLEDAQKLVERLSPKTNKLEDRTPKPRLRGGTSPEKEPEISSADVAKQILGR